MPLVIVALLATPSPGRAGTPRPAPPPRTRPRRYTALRSTMVVKVADPSQARRALLKKTKALGGHAALMTDRRLHLRVPPAQLTQLLTAVAKQGYVLDKQLTREDLTLAITRLRGQLRAKAAILARLRGFLDDSKVAATLQIERTMTQLITEIERTKGALRVAVDRATHAQVQIEFQFRSPTRLRYVRSPFAWINSVDIEYFLRGF